MGNTNQQKKIPVINKTQLQVACTKARIHLQMMRDRKNAQIIRGQRELVAKLKSTNRNKVQQLLLAERVTNGLKYAQACNQLASFAATLKSQANFVAQNVGKPQKIEPWLMYIYSLQFAADHMGLSSLNDFRHVIRSLYDPLSFIKHCNQDIVLLLSPTPVSQEINIYMVQMSQRNQIPLEEINIIGHKFTRQWQEPPVELDQHLLDVKKHLADQISKNMGNGNNNGNNDDFPYGNQGGFGNQGGQGNQGNQRFNNQGGQGGYGNQGGQQGGFDNQGGQGGYGNQGGNQGGFGQQQVSRNPYNQNPDYRGNQNPNPYKDASSINTGPQYYEPKKVQPQNNQKPKQFSSFQQMIKMSERNSHKLPLYPDIDPKQYKSSHYKPVIAKQSQVKPLHNPFTPPQQQQSHNSPTLSQIMKDFDRKE